MGGSVRQGGARGILTDRREASERSQSDAVLGFEVLDGDDLEV